jgi:glycosyltransferase involved in cell wall biosynthesis
LHRQATQTGLPFEILLMDDASEEYFTNRNEAICLPFLRFIRLPENIGRSRIRNRLAQEAQYPYLIFMDCDSAVPSENYISNYISYCQPNIVCYGGRIYEEQKPDPQKYLRWKYGRARESQPVAERLKNPNHGFETNNFLIDRSLFEKIRFDESLDGYGHEDTLFGLQLLAAGIPIQHIDNPLIHIGLEDAETFLRKTESGIRNLKKINDLLLQQDPVYIDHSRLVRTKAALDQLKLSALTAIIFSLFKPLIRKNLLGKYPSLFLFDLYKLGNFCGL